MPSCRSASPSSGACPPHLGPEPLLYTLIRDHPAHFWDKQVLPEGASAPKGDSGQEQLLRPLPCLPPHCLISSLVMFQAPGETGRNPESPPQKWQTAAPPWSRLLPSATLQLRAAFSLSLRLPPAERLAFRRRMEKRRAATSCLLWELMLRASHGGRVQANQDPTGGWDRALGTQRQQDCLVVHLTGRWFFLGVPIQQLPPLLFQNSPSPSDCVCGQTGREGPWGEGASAWSRSEPAACSDIPNCSETDSSQIITRVRIC